jgi:hypothetical protein
MLATQTPAERALGLIDHRNLPSKRLVSSLGFVEVNLPGIDPDLGAWVIDLPNRPRQQRVSAAPPGALKCVLRARLRGILRFLIVVAQQDGDEPVSDHRPGPLERCGDLGGDLGIAVPCVARCSFAPTWTTCRARLWERGHTSSLARRAEIRAARLGGARRLRQSDLALRAGRRAARNRRTLTR